MPDFDGLPQGGGYISVPGSPAANVDPTSGKAPAARELDGTQLAALHGRLLGTLRDDSGQFGLPPPGPVDPDSAGEVAAHLGAIGEAETAADLYAVLALFHQSAQTVRNAEREQRDANLQAQVKELQSAAGEMRNAATMRFNGAVVSGALQIGSAGLQVGLASASMAQSLRGAAAGAEGKSLVATGEKMGVQQGTAVKVEGFQTIARGEELTAHGAALNSYGQAASTAGGGIGQIAGAAFTLAADLHDADKAEHEAAARMFEANSQRAGDLMHNMQEVMRELREKLQAMQAAAVETNRTIARNI